VRFRRVFVVVSSPNDKALSTRIVLSRTSFQRRASASPGRNPAYASTETSVASRNRFNIVRLTDSICRGDNGSVIRFGRFGGFRTYRAGLFVMRPPLHCALEHPLQQRERLANARGRRTLGDAAAQENVAVDALM
jgi:hypothetical protein